MILKFSILLTLQLLITIVWSQLIPTIPAPTISPTIKAINCTQLNTGKYRWITFTGVPGGPSQLANGINSCYYFPNNYHLVSWHEARDFCQSIGGTLASIHNYTMNYLLSNRYNFGTDSYSTIYWIGLSSLIKRGIYKWSDKTPSDYFNYSNITSTGDPIPLNVLDQGRCVSMKSILNNTYMSRVYVGKWFKDDCNANHKFICERKIDTTIPPTEPPPQGNCPPDWYQLANKKCIKYVNGSKNFNDSRLQCFQLGGELLSIHSEEEQNYITALTGDKPTPYIGYRKLNNYASWSWDDQKIVDYTNFGVVGDNSYSRPKWCITVVTNTTQPGKWLTVECDRKLSVICEKPLDPSIQNPGMKLTAQKCTISGFNSNAVQYRNSCYSFIDSDPNNYLTFSDAENSCHSNGGHLVSIVDPFEHSFLNYYLKENGRNDLYWTGLQSKNSEVAQNVTQLFEWTDDWPVYYTYWDKYEPANAGLSLEGCVSLAKNNSLWRTSMCNMRLPFICKKTTNSLPNMNSDKTGVCPKLNNINDQSMGWVDVDKRSRYCYWFSIDKKPSYNGVVSWTDASFQCRRRNGTLASVHSNHELLLLRSKLNQTASYYNTWIGLSKDMNGKYIWEDTTALDYTNWDPNEKIVSKDTNINDDSNNQCVEIRALDLLWKQQPCSGSKRNYFICEVHKIYSKTSVSPTIPITHPFVPTNAMKSSTINVNTPTVTAKHLMGTTKTPIIGEHNSNQSNKGLSGGAKAGIAFGIIGGVIIICLIGYFTFKRYRPNSPIISSIENSLYASRRNLHNRGNNSGPGNDPVVTYSKDSQYIHTRT